MRALGADPERQGRQMKQSKASPAVLAAVAIGLPVGQGVAASAPRLQVQTTAASFSQGRGEFVNFDGRTLSLSTWGANKLVGTVTGGVLTGAATNDTLQDLGFRSTLTGGVGHDTYYVVNVDTVVVEKAGEGNDTVYAYRDYRLTANVENLIMAGNGWTGVGNELDNILISRGTRNVLEGGRGNDVLADESASTTRFQFNVGDGKDVVYGFTATGVGADLIKLTGYGYNTFAEIKSHMTQSGSDVLIRHDNGDQILVKNMAIGDLSASNFMLPVNLSNYHLSFAEDFNTISLVNPSTGLGTWKTQFATGAQNSIWNGYTSRTLTPNHELQLYVDPFLTGTGSTALGLNPFHIDNGVVTIHAGRTAPAIESALWGYDYTSGLLTTQTSFAQTYGYFEIRAQLPSGQGVWPAFWLLPVNRSASISELDVFEQLGGTTLYQTAHSGTAAAASHTGFSTLVPTATSGFHTYGVLWTAETITWYIDGVASASMPTPADMHQPMYMLVNLAIGGDWGGNPTDAFTGADLLVDYVHVYALNSRHHHGR
jgi:serralysin